MANTTADTLRDRVRAAIESEREHLVEVGETIRLNPELGYQEFIASQTLADQLREAGFEVEKPYKGLETAFRATRKGSGDGPTVAILAEYDALKGIGHGCGHNLIGASGLAVALGLGAVLDEVNGTVVIMGTPAEEGGGGKVRLLEAGAFDDIDAVLMIHHMGDETGSAVDWPDGTSLATNGLGFEFFGKPAHAAGDPYNGVNALNAVIQTFEGIDALRQHITMDARIHGIITHGGDAANVVPKYAACSFGIRASFSETAADLAAKVRHIAEGAALVTGCELKVTERDAPYADKRPSYVLGRKFHENMAAAGLDTHKMPKGRMMASTDLGNVSHRAPAVAGYFAISETPIPHHSQQVLDASGSEYGYGQFVKASTAMAWTALDVLLDPAMSKAAWDEHANWLEKYSG
ncbi:MAG TPA: M20 family metallopeptidase [Thermomicrobiales bacterium]|nr:M20 family metallopeptidase [Thermomicrobiales bacterium]HQZ89129.1 M20 family metallopeptidase [Thermomicrobiales bacterium]HRA32335.1 M20 family metallopeptidase [Thermomicrobiales bacterium]